MRRAVWWLRDRFMWALARLIILGLSREFVIRGHDRLDTGGPRLVVANHFNGFFDVVVLIGALGGIPHFVAKADLFRRAGLRWTLRALGAVPVHRREDAGDDHATSQDMFEEVIGKLGQGRTVAIFPEGTVTDEQRLQRIRSGAARITVGAAASGIDDLSIVPVGITYDDKAAARTRTLVEVGEPISARVVLGTGAVAGPAIVHDITGEIRGRLAEVSPDYGSLAREARLMRVAEIVVRGRGKSPFGAPSIAEQRTVAQQIAHLPESVEESIVDAVGRYEFELNALGLEDDQVYPERKTVDLMRYFVGRLIRMAVVLPFAYVGFTANILPLLAVIAAGMVAREPVSKGTARIVTALIAFPIAWLVTVWGSQQSEWRLALTVLVLATASVATVVSVQLVLETVEAGINWRVVRNRRAFLPAVRERRQWVVDQVRAALARV